MDKDVQPQMCFKRGFKSLKVGILRLFSFSVAFQIQSNRTPRQSNSYPVTFKSFRTEICMSLIRTWWKQTSPYKTFSLIKGSYSLSFLKSTWVRPAIRFLITKIRTCWKCNSYSMESNSHLVEKIVSLIRTRQNFIRSLRQGVFVFKQELFKTVLSISTFIYINKGLINYGRI